VQYLGTKGESGPLRIVVAEDYYPLTMTTTWALESEGHEVRYCLDGQDVFALVERFKPHVVLMDLMMPKVDGVTACKKIRTLKESGNILVVACSAWSNLDTRQDFLAAGFDAYYLKPFNVFELSNFIRSWHKIAITNMHAQ
jgi:DNA-binding response OmpR family regulator